MKIMLQKRLIFMAMVIAVAAACSSAPPAGTGAQTSGTPAQQTSSAGGSPSDDGGATPTPPPAAQPPDATPASTAVCGNGAVESGEQCDDGNLVSGDGCSAICKAESCGDAIVHSGLSEECDGSNLNGSACSTFGFSVGNLLCNGACTFDKSGCSNPVPAPLCGNAAIESGEQCDDGNLVLGDGCSATCKTESCGDGIVQSGLSEECDGSNLNGSACSTFGYSAGSLSCSGGCKIVKTGCSAVCGNGFTETSEQCDDSNTHNWDGCTSLCQNETLPALESSFASDDGKWTKKFKPTGSITYGAANAQAVDQKVASLVFSGAPGASPANASQIKTNTFLGFGMYRARVSLATCAATEEVVNGIFVYSYSGGTDGTTTLPVDGNANGIKDNNEIDFEVLCGEPQYLWLSSWTDYDEVGGVETFRKVTRVVDMTTGKAYQTVPGKEGEYGLGATVVETITDAITPGFATTGAFYELGFDWQPTYVRFFIMLNGKEVTLWTLNNTSHPNGVSYIPQNKAAMMFNLWHTGGHWYAGGAAVSPANPATMNVDWFKYWAN